MDCKQNFDNKLWHTFIDYNRYGLQSNEANYIYLNVENSNHDAFPQSTRYHMVFRLKACETVTTGDGAKSQSRTLSGDSLTFFSLFFFFFFFLNMFLFRQCCVTNHILSS